MKLCTTCEMTQIQLISVMLFSLLNQMNEWKASNVTTWQHCIFIGVVSKLQSKTQKAYPPAQRPPTGTPPVPDASLPPRRPALLSLWQSWEGPHGSPTRLLRQWVFSFSLSFTGDHSALDPSHSLSLSFSLSCLYTQFVTCSHLKSLLFLRRRSWPRHWK